MAMTWMQLYRCAVLRRGSVHYLVHRGMLAARASCDRALQRKLAAQGALVPSALFAALDAHQVPVPFEETGPLAAAPVPALTRALTGAIARGRRGATVAGSPRRWPPRILVFPYPGRTLTAVKSARRVACLGCAPSNEAGADR